MNRRNLFGFLAATPFCGVALKDTVQAKAIPSAEIKPTHPLGYLMDTMETYESVSFDPGHTHGYIFGLGGISRRQIWDGQRFVPLDSAEGAEVCNKLLSYNQKQV